MLSLLSSESFFHHLSLLFFLGCFQDQFSELCRWLCYVLVYLASQTWTFYLLPNSSRTESLSPTSLLFLWNMDVRILLVLVSRVSCIGHILQTGQCLQFCLPVCWLCVPSLADEPARLRIFILLAVFFISRLFTWLLVFICQWCFSFKVDLCFSCSSFLHFYLYLSF